jgi:hypothetical protein
MAAKRRSKPQDELAVVDEQGDYFPPATALAAFLEGFGNESQYDGTLVEVQAYLSDQDMFEVLPVDYVFINGATVHRPHETLYAYARELRPVNKHTQDYVKAVTEVAVEVYDVEVYDLRDMLSLIDINVKAESVAKWDGMQRGKIRLYAAACIAVANDHRGVKVPPKPKELP